MARKVEVGDIVVFHHDPSPHKVTKLVLVHGQYMVEHDDLAGQFDINLGAIRAVKSYQSLNLNEVAVQINLQLPDQLFRKPALVADLVIPEDAVQQPTITAEVTENIADAIRTATGIEVKLSVTNPDEDE